MFLLEIAPKMHPVHVRQLAIPFLGLGLALSACASNSGSGASSGGSGATPGSSAGSGAAQSSGGSTPGTGGAPNGTAGSGGANSATGGRATGSGGANGGAPAGGGNAAGASAGGVTNAGGSSSAGSTSVGGSSAGGSGGAPTSGGACVESQCGSHKWACWKMPNPASSPSTVPNHQSYTDLGSGAVRDNVTCLVWEKANPATQGTWQASVDRCAALGASNYAGFGDWRMPTRVEMSSIVDVTNGSKGFAPIFTVSSGYYNTASWWYETITGQNTSGFAFAYGTNGFSSNAVAMGNTNNVARCVRGNGPGEAADAFAKEPANHYTVATGEVTDNYTGLIWQQGFSPARMAWADAPAYCSGLALNGHTGWRVPTLNELTSTVNEALVGGAVNRTVFPNNPNGCGATYWFWAAEASKVGGTAWGLSYCDGFTGWNAASATWNTFPDANVRCVR